MRLRSLLLLPLLSVLVLWGCGSRTVPENPPPECGPNRVPAKNDEGVWSCVCEEGFELVGNECVEPEPEPDPDPVPDPDPTPDPDPDPQPDPEPDPDPNPEPGGCSERTPPAERPPQCYVSHEEAKDVLRWKSSVEVGFIEEGEEMIWLGRNFETVLSSGCDVSGPPFRVAREELEEFMVRAYRQYYGRDTEREADELGPAHPSWVTYRVRLDGVNRRCRRDAGIWCTVTDVYAPTWDPWHETFRAELDELREVNGRSRRHDGMLHWCRTRR